MDKTKNTICWTNELSDALLEQKHSRLVILTCIFTCQMASTQYRSIQKLNLTKKKYIFN